jgi:hypothetical protein
VDSLRLKPPIEVVAMICGGDAICFQVHIHAQELQRGCDGVSQRSTTVRTTHNEGILCSETWNLTKIFADRRAQPLVHLFGRDAASFWVVLVVFPARFHIGLEEELRTHSVHFIQNTVQITSKEDFKTVQFDCDSKSVASVKNIVIF